MPHLRPRSRALQEVPTAFAETLRRLLHDRDPRLNPVLAEARRLGWSTATLAATIDREIPATGKRIERARDAEASIEGVDIPLPEPVQTMMNGARLPLTEIERLRAMQEVARKVNGSKLSTDPDRDVSRQLSAELDRLIREEHVTVYYLAKVLGVSNRAIASRLERHGHRVPSPSVTGSASEHYLGRGVGEPENDLPALDAELRERLRDLYEQTRGRWQTDQAHQQKADELHAELRALIEQGWPTPVLAREMRVPHQQLKRWLARQDRQATLVAA